MGDPHASLMPAEAPVQLIDEHGAPTEPSDGVSSMPSDEKMIEAYEALVMGRRVNDQFNALVRQGRIAVYPASTGQEACQVAAALALGENDWLFPTYRDSVALISRGIPPREVLTSFRGDWHCGYDPKQYGVAPQATPLATQLLHAVGFAQAAKKKGEDVVTLAMIGDGATSEGDFHEALNFAAVFKAPVIFLIQNNEFAISVPLSRQTAAPSLAHKGIGYGMPGQRVDGNDVAALLSVLTEAVDRARAGEGPTVIEAHTYRMLAHTNADDDTRYREREEVQQWVARDPLSRVKTYLTNKGALTEELESTFTEKAEEVAKLLRDATAVEEQLNPEELFNHVYSERPQSLQQQWEELEDELARTEGAA